ncbi:MAG: hypothetical protein ACRDSP_13995 [Pseudonocardiaceae bacterium]
MTDPDLPPVRRVPANRGLEKTTCKSCGDVIMWVVTVDGKRMPIDGEPTETGTVSLTGHVPPLARVVSRTGRYPGQRLYVSHFATCRHADLHRKPVATRRITPPAMPQEGLFSEVSGR